MLPGRGPWPAINPMTASRGICLGLLGSRHLGLLLLGHTEHFCCWWGRLPPVAAAADCAPIREWLDRGWGRGRCHSSPHAPTFQFASWRSGHPIAPAVRFRHSCWTVSSHGSGGGAVRRVGSATTGPAGGGVVLTAPVDHRRIFTAPQPCWRSWRRWAAPCGRRHPPWAPRRRLTGCPRPCCGCARGAGCLDAA